MINKECLQKFIWEEMRSKIARYPTLGEVIYESLASIYELLEKTEKSYRLLAYVRRTEDGLDENVLHIQMPFKDIHERDLMWDETSEKLAQNILRGMEKASTPEEKLEIENILCAVKSEK
ncbi:hypothetical protein IBX65_00870 [Candidatus Aerophobetes bacterium]|nr:hypothetical protein [Candidatus Aerophobetes bacterium]